MAIGDWDPRNPQVQINSGGGVPQIVYGMNEDASETFKAGNLVTIDASGQVNSIPDSTGGDTPVAGIAMKAATTVSSSEIEIPVMMLTPEVDVLIRVADGSEALEASSACVPGVGYDLQELSTNLQAINREDTSNMAFVYVGPVLDSQGASTYWGRFRLLYLESQFTAE